MPERSSDTPNSSYSGDGYPLMDEELFMSLRDKPEQVKALIALFKAIQENPSKAFRAKPQEVVEQNPHSQQDLRELQTMLQAPAEYPRDEVLNQIHDRILALQVAEDEKQATRMLGQLLFQRFRYNSGELNETNGKPMGRRGWHSWSKRTDETLRLRKKLTENLRNRKPSEWGQKTRDEVKRNRS